MAVLHVRIFLPCILSVLIVCVSGRTADGSFQDELLVRIQALEKQGLGQAENMLKMEMRIEDQNEKLNSQEKTIREYRDRVRELERTVAELRIKDPEISEHSGDIPEGVDRYHGIVRQGQSINTGVGKEAVKQRRVLVNEGPVSFHAVIKSYSAVNHIRVDQKIIFPDVNINLGGGYHSLNGIFIAPRSGIYIFSTSIMSYSTGHVEIAVQLMKNGQALAKAYAHSDSGRHDQGSITAVTQLAAGDVVWVSLASPDDATLWGNYYDSFTGCLVVPL